MTMITQDIRISCQNSVIKGSGAKSNEGHPWRNWKITLVAMDGEKEVKGKLSVILDHVEYILHPTFEEPRRVKKEEPYLLQEKGWGEFDMRVVLYFTENITDPQVLLFDLNFALSTYSITHTVKFPNASPELVELLSREPLPRKGGKKPMNAVQPASQPPTTTSPTKAKKSSTERTSKKKPVVADSPPSKVAAKKAKSDTKRKSSLDKTMTANRLYSSPSPLIPPPSSSSLSSQPSMLARSPSFTDLSPMQIPVQPTESARHSSFDYVETPAEHVYNLSDVYNLSPIHHAKVDKSVREKWNIPQINMMELAKRMYGMTTEQNEEVQRLIVRYQSDTIKTVVGEDASIGIDLYSLGRPLLEKIWDYLADMASDDNESFTSQDHHPSDLEFGSDADIGQYSDDGEIFDHRPMSDVDEPGFHLSDLESDQEHRLVNGHPIENGHPYHRHHAMDHEDDDY
ncbi:yeats family-domain-containing protein [Blakeslea trispora]|nr:yeats family-domain-containing protein [Blakeslea trispora]